MITQILLIIVCVCSLYLDHLYRELKHELEEQKYLNRKLSARLIELEDME